MNQQTERLKLVELAIAKESTQVDDLNGRFNEARVGSDESNKKLRATQTARALLTKLAEANQENVALKINDILTHALQTIFENPSYTTGIRQGSQRNTPTVKLSIGDGDFETDSIIDQRGGGISAIASFILSILVHTRANPAGSRTFILDERFNFVPRAALPAVTKLLSNLAEKANCQFVLITHQQELIEGGDVVYELKRVQGTARVRRVV